MTCRICRTRPPLTDSLACKGCVDEITVILADLDALLPMLRGLLRQGRTSTGRGRVDASPAPLRVDVLSLLDPRNTHSPGRVLARWATLFATRATPDGLRQALGRIVEHEQLPAFVRDIRALHTELKRVCGEPGSRIVATCRRDLPTPDDETRECGGPIVATPGGTTATCQACGEQWPRAKWKFLGRLQHTG